MIIEMKLLMAVMDTESAVSPRETWLIRLEVTPPGQAAKIISPIAIRFDRPNKCAIPNAIRGRMMSWLNRPMRIGLGDLNILLKSSIVSDKPIPNIMIKRHRGRITLVRIVASKGDDVLLTKVRLSLMFFYS